MSEQSTSGPGLLGYAAVLWAALPDTAAAQVASGGTGASGVSRGSGVPGQRAGTGAANPPLSATTRRRIGA